MKNMLGFSDDEIASLMNQGNIYFNCETWFAGESYDIKDEGTYKAKDWFVSEKKSQRSGDTEYSSFQSGLPSTRHMLKID